MVKPVTVYCGECTEEHTFPEAVDRFFCKACNAVNNVDVSPELASELQRTKPNEPTVNAETTKRIVLAAETGTPDAS